VRVAWVTHHLPGDRGNPSLLSGGFAGGAEMLDWEMVACAPDGVEVSWVPPDEWERASEFDRVVVTGTDLLSQHAMLKLAQLEPVVWVHHRADADDGTAEAVRGRTPVRGHVGPACEG
jgi:hypothetical protein